VEETYWKNVWYYGGKEGQEIDAIRNFLRFSRISAALELASHIINHVPLELLVEILEADVPEYDIPNYQTMDYQIAKILKQISDSGEYIDDEIAKLEMRVLPVIINRYVIGQEYEPALYRVIFKDPKLFFEIFSQVYLQEDTETDDTRETNEHAINIARLFYKLLESINRIPAQNDDGTIDEKELSNWVDEVLKLCDESSRSIMGKTTIGELLARSPVGEDDVWPCKAVRNVIEKLDSMEVDDGFFVRTLNQRGVTTRNPLDGGEQEHELAAHYRNAAGKLYTKWPRTAAILERLSNSYEADGKSWDSMPPRS
jgi:hypothetical protein